MSDPVLPMREVLDAWKKGATAPELAELYGVPPLRIWRACEPALFGLPVPKMRRKRKWSRPEITRRRKRVIELWHEGWSCTAIAERFRIAKSTISGYLATLPSRRRLGSSEEAAWPLPRRSLNPAFLPPRRRTIEAPKSDPLPSRVGKGARPERRAVTPEIRAEILESARRGYSAYRLARIHEVSANTIRAILREENPPC